MRSARRGEYCAVVTFEHAEPVRNILRMVDAGFRGDFQGGTQERCTQLSHQFFHGVGLGTEPPGKAAIAARLGTSPVRLSRVRGRGNVEQNLLWHLEIVGEGP